MKFISGFAAICLAFTVLLSGCAGNSLPNDNTVTDTAQTDNSTEDSTDDSGDDVVETQEEHEKVTMLLAAAASLEDSFKNTLIPMFTEQYPWITVEGTYDSSGKLQTQIEEGLEASVFMSAATKQMNALVESGLIDSGKVVELLENEIVLIAPIDSDSSIDSFERIVEADSIALGDPASVPVGQYSEEALTTLGVWEEIQSKTSFGTNVTEVLNQVAEGSVDVGIVYATDAAQKIDQVKIIASAPDGSLANKVIYPVGILADAPQQEAAELFLEFLQSADAMNVFVTNGFKANN